MTCKDALLSSLKAQARYNSAVQARPACILWPDKDRLWERVFPSLAASEPAFFALGSYAPEERRGPAVWIRCAIEGSLGDDQPPLDDAVPVIYLPGYSRRDLRAIAACPRELQFLAELQYSGAVWSHPNGRDWTPFAFLTSDKAGLCLSIDEDAETKEALQNALSELLERELESLKGQTLGASFFRGLVVPTPERDILEWIAAKGEVKDWNAEKRSAFKKTCQKDYGCPIESEGVLGAAARLAEGSGKWADVFALYADAWSRYGAVTEVLERLKAPAGAGELFADHSRYPAANAAEEGELRAALLSLADTPQASACAEVARLEKQHGERRSWLWARMGKAPLATALEKLSELAHLVVAGGGGADAEAMRKAYAERFWRVDAAAVEALAIPRTKADREAVEACLRSLYLPWVEAQASQLQGYMTVDPARHAGEARGLAVEPYAASTCVVFVDGLRYEGGKKLASLLEKKAAVALEARWSALPSITAIGKFAVSPAGKGLIGKVSGDEFGLYTQADERVDHLRHRAMLDASGYQVLGSGEVGDPTGLAWTEIGDIDKRGHEAGARLAKDLDGILAEIAERVEELLEAGWSRVRVVTDHGWLLVPGGLPKKGLPPAFTLSKWGRCGILAPNAPACGGAYAWPLSASVRAVTAPGAGSFIEGREYAHGGISVQENLIPVLTVEGNTRGQGAHVAITSIRWTNLMCKVVVRPAQPDLRLDIRTAPANAGSSVVHAVKAFKEGTASVAVPNEDLEGTQAFVVVIDANGEIAAQEKTVIGE